MSAPVQAHYGIYRTPEIESVGQSQIDAVESWWFQAFLHDLKAEAWPLARDPPAWRGDARGFCAQARRKYQPSMR